MLYVNNCVKYEYYTNKIHDGDTMCMDHALLMLYGSKRLSITKKNMYKNNKIAKCRVKTKLIP